MNNRIHPRGISICVMAALMVILSSCDKEKMAYDKIEGTWTLTSDPSCTWTFLNQKDYHGNRKCLISVDTFNAIECRYYIDNNTLKIWKNQTIDHDGPDVYVEDSYLSVDEISKNILHLSGNIRIYEITYEYHHVDHNTTISYEFRKSN